MSATDSEDQAWTVVTRIVLETSTQADSKEMEGPKGVMIHGQWDSVSY